MNKVWSGYIDTCNLINPLQKVGVIPATAYLAAPGRRTVWGISPRSSIIPNPFFISFPYTLFLCAHGPRPSLFVNFLDSPEFTTETTLYPTPFPNCFNNGEICLGDDVNGPPNHARSQPNTDSDLINFFFSVPFVPTTIATIRFGKERVDTLGKWSAASKQKPDLWSDLIIEPWHFPGSMSRYPWRLSQILDPVKPKFARGQVVKIRPQKGVPDNQKGIVSMCCNTTKGRRYYVVFSRVTVTRLAPGGVVRSCDVMEENLEVTDIDDNLGWLLARLDTLEFGMEM